jgi:quercetin dioxygenase-like cupin family protein
MKKPMSPNLKRLEELILGKSPGIVEYEGGIQGQALHSEAAVAIQICSSRGKSFLDAHKHDATEVVVVFSGEFTFEFPDGTEAVVDAGKVIRFAPGVLHGCRAVPGSRAVGILIPREQGYPDVSR